MKKRNIVPIARAAEIVGVDPRWLRRHLLRREKAIGQRIMIRVGEGTKRQTYHLSMSELRVHEPTLFDRRDEFQIAMRHVADDVSERIRGMTEEISDLRRNVAALADAHRRRGLR